MNNSTLDLVKREIATIEQSIAVSKRALDGHKANIANELERHTKLNTYLNELKATVKASTPKPAAKPVEKKS